MKNKNLNFEEFMQEADECVIDDDDLLEMEGCSYPGNPYGAGRYQYSRSSEDYKALLLDDGAGYNEEYRRWFEYMGCGYACGRDGEAMMEADEIDMWNFHTENPLISCREAFFDLEYGNTRQDVSRVLIFLTEYEAGKYRDFSCCLYDISMEEMEGYIAAIENWHGTGEFNVGQYHGIPAYDPWRKR